MKYKIDMFIFGDINISMVVKMKGDACSACLQPQQAEQMRMELKDGAVGMGKCSISSEKPELHPEKGAVLFLLFLLMPWMNNFFYKEGFLILKI